MRCFDRNCPCGGNIMALRSSWDGFLKLSLISIPVRAYNAAVRDRGEVRFHQVHKDCGERIRYQKVCPIHGEVKKEEIVSGYEYEKGEHLQFDPGELKKARAQDDETISIDLFTRADEIDPRYYSGKTYYLAPEGRAGQKPYALLHRVMSEQERSAIARIVISGQEETVLIRPLENLLVMHVLFYENQVKAPDAFASEVGDADVKGQELELARTLVEASSADKFDFSEYKDLYTERVTKLIEAKSQGKTVRGPHKEKAPAVINLMDALRKSLKETQGDRKPSRRHAAPRRRKTG
jgi:DNA end-binding protein Ku